MKWKPITTICVCSLVFGVTCYAAGAGGIEKIQAYLNHDIKFTVNGKAWTPKDDEGVVLAPVILNGTSYLPIKAVAQAVNGQAQWNDDTKTIVITSTREVTERDQMIIKKVNEVKEKLKLGLTQEEVQALFKEKYELAQGNGDLENGSDAYWKYNFFKEPGYSRPDIPDHIVDEDGLKTKKIGAYLFIGWKNNKTHLYSISYVNPKDNRVYLFVMNPDGTTSDSPVSN
ncbi:copper amine oxidase N-terminal domain-containing protein [Paenibacillus sp. SYP-B3998]|uniref:Copper amine oxidase N-terminal domain-containing protein n=1 Tax=Paenibacillus sp. SYP-B3998 TaxID=2678564 RepID=A0A6G3ZTP4_9BACL|nr:stalk domain-containing protein [Paenibacillus sp. SYP-B3998]NEW04787.1 copper amine oxidase N-terminal domain-containing protein [Paenibacillus sp. SYP-B3998]